MNSTDFILENRGLLQANAFLHKLSVTRSLSFAYEVYLHCVPVIITFDMEVDVSGIKYGRQSDERDGNDEEKSEKKEEGEKAAGRKKGNDWLHKNCRLVELRGKTYREGAQPTGVVNAAPTEEVAKPEFVREKIRDLLPQEMLTPSEVVQLGVEKELQLARESRLGPLSEVLKTDASEKVKMSAPGSVSAFDLRELAPERFVGEDLDESAFVSADEKSQVLAESAFEGEDELSQIPWPEED